MSFIQVIVLGVIQGIAEFLPISSSAHLILVPYFFGWSESPLVFDTSLHLGTALAIIIYFYKDFLAMSLKMWIYLALGSLPVMLIGFLFDDYIETIFRSVNFIPLFLIIGSIFMYAADKYVQKSVINSEVNGKITGVVGIAQAFALLPGISRSGVTTGAGLFMGLSRGYAAKFSFLLSTPAVIAAGLYKLITTYEDINKIGYVPWILGIFVSFIVGYFTINFLLQYLKKNSLNVFIIYRLILALVILIITYI